MLKFPARSVVTPAGTVTLQHPTHGWRQITAKMSPWAQSLPDHRPLQMQQLGGKLSQTEKSEKAYGDVGMKCCDTKNCVCYSNKLW